jgi:acyl-CoA synthetase (AMP-forming)/AMP-acid ligase II
LLTFPLSHIAGFVSVFTAMISGGTVVLLRGWDAGAARDAIARYGVSTFAGVPSTALQLLAGPADDPRLATLEQISTGGAAAPPELVRQVSERFGGRMEAQAGYGLTETGGRLIGIAGERYRRHPDSIGAPSPAARVRVVGPDGTECSEGTVGELELIGQSVFQGYWGDPEATDAAFDDGWFRTGDLAYVRGGDVYLVDRIEDAVMKGGERVSSVEVESVLFEHPDVADVAVVAVPHPDLGSEVAALVVPRAGVDPEPEALRAHAAARLAGFKVPTRIVVRAQSLPRNANGKVLKREVRAELSRTVPREPG